MRILVSKIGEDIENGWTIEVPASRFFDFSAIRLVLASRGIYENESLQVAEVNENSRLISDIVFE